MSSRASDWERVATELVAEANDRFVRDAAPALRLNERVLRDYVRRGIVARPRRRGKEAVYGRRQLMQVVAARRLLADGWPLAKVAERLRGLDDVELARDAGMSAPRAGAATPAGLAEEAAVLHGVLGPPEGRGTNTVTVTPKGEITLSKHVLKTLGVQPGDRVAVDALPKGGLRLMPAPTGRISGIFGMLKKRGREPVSLENMKRVAARGWAGKIKVDKLKADRT